MSLRFHLFGTMCGGKTTIINKLKQEVPDIKSWDIKDNFYIPKKIIVNGRMDWDSYWNYLDLIPKELISFIENNRDVPIVLESSGLNKTINMAIKGKEFIPIYLKAPSKQEVLRRSKQRQEQAPDVVGIRRIYIQRMEKVKKYLPQPLTEDEAYDSILRRIEEEKTK